MHTLLSRSPTTRVAKLIDGERVITHLRTQSLTVRICRADLCLTTTLRYIKVLSTQTIIILVTVFLDLIVLMLVMLAVLARIIIPKTVQVLLEGLALAVVIQLGGRLVQRFLSVYTVTF